MMLGGRFALAHELEVDDRAFWSILTAVRGSAGTHQPTVDAWWLGGVPDVIQARGTQHDAIVRTLKLSDDPIRG